MIDIAFDIHHDNSFCGETFSVIKLEDVPSSWDDYKKQAELFIQKYAFQKTAVVKVMNNNFSINKFSVALFVASFDVSCPLNLVVFKVDDLEKTCEAYKPYLALTVALKYVLQLVDQPAEKIYNNVSVLGYLGISIQKDSIHNYLFLEYDGVQEGEILEFEGNNTFEALLYAAIIKTASLARLPLKLKIKLFMDMHLSQINMHLLAEQIIKKVSLWIK